MKGEKKRNKENLVVIIKNAVRECSKLRWGKLK